MAAPKTAPSAAALLKQQAELAAQLKEVPEIELLTELKRLRDQPEVREFVTQAHRIVAAAPPSTVANQVIGLGHIMDGLDANLEQRFAQLAAETAAANMASAEAKGGEHPAGGAE